VAVLAAPPWQQLQQQQQQLQAQHHDPQQQPSVAEQLPQQQPEQQQQQRSVVFASYLLIKLAQHNGAAVRQCCSTLPAALRQCISGPCTSSAPAVVAALQQSAPHADTPATAAASPVTSTVTRQAVQSAATAAAAAVLEATAADQVDLACYLQQLLHEQSPRFKHNCQFNSTSHEIAKQQVLLHIAATAPVELLVVVLQQQSALLPQLLTVVGSSWQGRHGNVMVQFVGALVATAPEPLLRQLLLALLQPMATTAAAGLSGSSSSSSSSGSGVCEQADPALCACALLALSSKLPDTVDASKKQLLLSILCEPQSLQLLGAALHSWQRASYDDPDPVEVFSWLIEQLAGNHTAQLAGSQQTQLAGNQQGQHAGSQQAQGQDLRGRAAAAIAGSAAGAG
jgi:hypothetical protein